MGNGSESVRHLCHEILQTCAVSNMRKLTRMTTNYFNEKMKPTGMKTTQICVLLAIGKDPGHPLSFYAEDMGMDLSTLVRSLETLEKGGYVSLVPGSRREKLASLTEEGEGKIEEVYPYWVEAQADFISSFGQEQWDTYLTALLQVEKVKS